MATIAAAVGAETRLDWNRIDIDLWADGFALVADVLTAAKCSQAAGWFERDELFRSTVHMARHRFGSGTYRYFEYPLPPLIARLRETLYTGLAPIANRWMEALSLPASFPLEIAAFVEQCAARGQRRPTPLLLRYDAGDWNALHQDLYGEVAFPLQATIFLSEPERDFSGGEFVLVEQRPRAQSRPHVIAPRRGSMLIFPNRFRPVRGARGVYRTVVRHGVSRVRSGRRFALGIIFHEAA